MALMDESAAKRAEFFKQKRAEGLGQVQAQQQEAQDVIQRRFSSLGAQGSGAQMAVEQKARDAAAAQARQVQTDVSGQELAAQEGDINRQFQSQEARLGREFAGQQQASQNVFAEAQAKLGREFTAQEQESQRRFLAGESEAARTLQSQMAADDLALKKSLAAVQQAQTQEQLDLAKKQYEVDLETTNFNKILSLVMAGIPIEEARKSVSGIPAKAEAGAVQQPVTSAQGAEQAFVNQGELDTAKAAYMRSKYFYNVAVSESDSGEAQARKQEMDSLEARFGKDKLEGV